MARKRLLGTMTEKKDVITDRAEEAIINQVSNILLRMRVKLSLKAWGKLLKIAEELDSNGTYTPTINALRGAFENNHPYLQFIEILAKKNPHCRKKLMTNFFLNAVFRGIRKREEFSSMVLLRIS